MEQTCGFIKVISEPKTARLLKRWGLVYVLLALFTADCALAQSTGVGGFDQSRMETAIAAILSLVEGAFGALVMIVSGLVAIIAAAMGAYRASMSALVVGVGAFILRAVVRLFFPDVEIPD